MSVKTSRRSFFESLLGGSNKLAIDSLEEYAEPLNLSDVYHLLKRCSFSIDLDFAQEQVGKTATEVLSILMADPGVVAKPSFDVDFAYTSPQSFSNPTEAAEQEGKNVQQTYEEVEALNNWWLAVMRNRPNTLHEKMLLFWHSHFTTESKSGIPAQWLYKQNALYRTFLTSDFRTILEKIILDGAMLIYLNGNQNQKDGPNENFARELLELFSVGIGDDNYTENDIREAAKILTGWQVNHYRNNGVLYEAFFDPNRFNAESKEVFGVTFNVDFELNASNVNEKSIKKLVDVILSEKGDKVALFMATKFYRFFVYSKNDSEPNTTIKELAEYFRSSGFDIKSTILKLLTSKHFFDQNNRGIQIKSPLENLLGIAAHFPSENESIRRRLLILDHELFDPPNVSGWKGYRTWITTKSLPFFIETFNSIILEESDLKIGSWAEQFPGFQDSARLTEDIALLLLGRLPSEDRLKAMEYALLGSAPYYEWPELSQNKENAGLRVKTLLKEIFKMPEFYLG